MANPMQNSATSRPMLWKLKQMPFGLLNEPGRFQKILDILLSVVKRQTALVYLDNKLRFHNTQMSIYSTFAQSCCFFKMLLSR